MRRATFFCALGALLAACFTPDLDYAEAQLACDQGACPPGYRCRADDRCARAQGVEPHEADASRPDVEAPPDAGPAPEPPDAAPPDASSPDASPPIPVRPDAAPSDASRPDAAPPMPEPPDAAPPEASLPDAAPPDAPSCTGPTPEICDGKDNDCDGVIDLLAQSCYEAATGCVDRDESPDGVRFDCAGRCRPGVRICTSPAQPEGSCTGWIGPGAERCNGIDDDCDGSTDEGFGVGDACEAGVGSCRTIGTLVCGADGSGVVCAAPVIPGSAEVCDGVDNDCDGSVDEEPLGAPIHQACGGVGCQAGTFACDPSGTIVCVSSGSSSAEICNGQDDDCDGFIDEGFAGVGSACFVGLETCTSPGWLACSADGSAVVCEPVITDELCDGLDNDCDGTVDDLPVPPPWPIGEPCGSPGQQLVCSEGRVVCAGASPMAELCNLLDDDGNGLVDDGDLPGVGDACGEVRGECRAGTIACIAGALACVGYVGPQPEICDGLDNDCDGVIDGMVELCGPSEPLLGICEAGTRVCTLGVEGPCVGYVGPQPEVCDGLDNDCDGEVDDLATCPNETDECFIGSCWPPCVPGEPCQR